MSTISCLSFNKDVDTNEDCPPEGKHQPTHQEW